MIVSNMASALWTASETVDLSPTTCSKPLAVSQHSHKIVVLSALGRLVSERNNNSFSSVNPPLRGLYCIQLRLCQICSECEAFLIVVN